MAEIVEFEDNGFETLIRSKARTTPGVRIAARVGVVLIALAILFWRTPTTFTNPQFWGEDVVLFFHARLDGWPVMTIILAGYLTFVQGAVAFLLSYLSPTVAPAAYAYSAVCLTLLVVWLVTSPRLDMPYKPLLAVAVVVVPMGREELGALCNIQWILPIGAFAILFMSASRSPLVLAGEATFVGLVAFTGPFSLFLAPLYIARTYLAEPSNRSRLLLLTSIIGAGGAVQAFLILTHPTPVDFFPSSPTLWITIPINQIITTFGIHGRLLDGALGATIGVIYLASAAALSILRPYRMQKIFMLLFGLAIAFGGLYKFHNAIASQAFSQRYFYMISVFSLWFICCMSTAQYFRRPAFATAVVIFELVALASVRNRPLITEDFEWRTWARFIDSGLQVLIPTPPAGWSVGFAATSTGPLAKFAPWIGRRIGDVASIDPSACQGTTRPVTDRPRGALTANFPVDQKIWLISGSASAEGNPVQLIAITDPVGTVVGFGFPGFKGTGWYSILPSRPENPHAFGIVDDGKRACPLLQLPFS